MTVKYTLTYVQQLERAKEVAQINERQAQWDAKQAKRNLHLASAAYENLLRDHVEIRRELELLKHSRCV